MINCALYKQLRYASIIEHGSLKAEIIMCLAGAFFQQNPFPPPQLKKENENLFIWMLIHDVLEQNVQIRKRTGKELFSLSCSCPKQNDS